MQSACKSHWLHEGVGSQEGIALFAAIKLMPSKTIQY